MMKKRAMTWICAAVLLLASAGCGGTAAVTPPQAQHGERTPIEAGGTFTAADDGGLRLTVDTDTLQIAVEDTADGRVWRTCPADAADDPVALEDYRAYMRSDLQITYLYGRNVRTANSAEECVDRQQYALYRIDGGVRVEYTFGDMGLTIDDLPQQLTAARARALVLEAAGVSEEQRALFSACFEEQADGSFLRLSNVFGSKQEELIALFMQIGYSAADLRRDAQDFGETVEAEEKLGFMIPVEYTVAGGVFRASVRTDEIVMPQDSPILTLTLLPFFGAAADGAGYTFMPDGSGVLLDHADKSVAELTLSVYGSDASIGEPSPPSAAQPVLLPVFGMAGDGSAYLAVVEEGDAVSTLHAVPAGKTCGYHTAYASFTVTAQDTMDTGAVSAVGSSVAVRQKRPVGTALTVSYRFLHGADAGYAGMARAYRQQLIDGGLTGTAPDAGLLVETVGAIESGKSLLGIRYTGLTALTTYDRTAQIVQAIRERGVEDIAVRFSGWTGTGYERSLTTRFDSLRVLGGTKALTALAAQADTYLDISLMRFDTARGIRPARDGARRLDQQYVRAYLNEKEEGYLISPARLPDLAQTAADRLSRYRPAKIAVRDLGNAAYADYDRRGEIDRQQGLQAVVDALQTLSADGGLLLAQANARTLRFAAHVTDVPSGASGRLSGGRSVPFYQMVVHGLVGYSFAPINLSSTAEEDLLRAAESGAGLSCLLSYTDLGTLDDVLAPQLYSVWYKDHLDTVAADVRRLAEALDGLGAQQIVGHRYRTAQCTETVYESGVRILVNFGASPVTVDGTTVEARSFLRLPARSGEEDRP